MAREGASTTPASAGTKRRSSISSIASSVHRRSSISSTTSSGRKRKEQSLVDVAASLGQRTPERSQNDDDGISTRSRQLDFGTGEEGDDADDDYVEEGQNDESEKEENAQPVAKPAAITPARRKRGGGRRNIIYWTVEEEEFLRKEVEKFGVGSWKKILIAGQGVFSSHRTNVDLKDKWKNMSRVAPRKRRRNVPKDIPENEESVETQSIRSSAPREERKQIPSLERVAARPRRQAAAIATLKIGTNQTFPELVEINVNLNTCKDVAALLEYLHSSLLSNAGDADVQVIGLKTKQLYDDDELLLQCIKSNGVEFYLVYEENPEEFV